MKINFIGNFQRGYVEEVADETHLVRELKKLGHKVTAVPRDQWKAFVDGRTQNPDWVLPKEADINIICKWPHFNDEKYIDYLRSESNAPVFYWVWDFMDYNIGGFHRTMSEACDLLLTGEGAKIQELKKYGINARYFQFDVCDGNFSRNRANVTEGSKKYKVAFFGSHFKVGDRLEWIKEINKTHKVTIFSWNYKEWLKEGLEAYPAVWGDELTEKINQSKIILGFNVNDHCWGYWSNRVGKVLTRGGFLLQRYVPGMELFLQDGAEYFSSVEEANQKIEYYLTNTTKRSAISSRGSIIGRMRFTSEVKVKQLEILIERYLNHGI
ncbi:MAG TPA: hypothetical protein ENI23_11460 [bacterium]|nr:hypothetical protein [bacterium]